MDKETKNFLGVQMIFNYILYYVLLLILRKIVYIGNISWFLISSIIILSFITQVDFFKKIKVDAK